VCSSDLTFASLGVPEALCKTISKLGWKIPTPIQTDSLPYTLSGKDVIGLAQTGSGKTGAFAIPIITSILLQPKPFYACVLSPTRELAIQIGEQFEALGSDIGLTTGVIVGGVEITPQIILLSRRPHIIIGTPGRILYHLQNTKGFGFKNLKYLVLDEADRLLSRF